MEKKVINHEPTGYGLELRKQVEAIILGIKKGEIKADIVKDAEAYWEHD